MPSRAGLFMRNYSGFFKHKPEKLRLYLGQGPSQALIDAADYVSEIKNQASL